MFDNLIIPLIRPEMQIYYVYLVEFEDSGPFGLLARIDSPYVTAENGNAYFEDCNILFAFLYLQEGI